LLKLIAAAGYKLTFVSDADRAAYSWVLEDVDQELPRYEADLRLLGTKILYGLEAAQTHLEAEGHLYTHVILSYPEVMFRYAPIVRAFATQAKLIYDTVDLHGLRFRREAHIKRDPEIELKADMYERMELVNLETADEVIAITPTERNEIRRICPRAAVHVVPNIHHPADEIPGPQGRNGLLFIGHYLHSPNEDAALYLVREILPRVTEQLGPVELQLLGSSMTDPIKALRTEQVLPTGYVEDPAPYFDRARVFVAPLRYGAGMKGKIGQSLSLGLPIVTTSIGSEGMDLLDGSHAFIADTADQFAAAVVKLYRDDFIWKRLSTCGRDHVRTNFSEIVVAGAVERMLGQQEAAATRP
jgi:glycosyltransferase involved in cell wall biosynthesis